MIDYSTLDVEELTHLALRAARQKDTASAIVFIKAALAQGPSGVLQYLLGAQYAELGMVDRAVQHMGEAIRLTPDLYMAHFQLGLLLAANQRPNEAVAVWAALDPLGDDNPIYLIKHAIVTAMRERYDDAMVLMEQGLARLTDNPDLHKDMSALRDRWRQLLDDGLTAPTTAEPEADPGVQSEGARHFLLSSYKKQ